MKKGNSFLVVGRYRNQTISIGDDVEVTILRIDGGQVRVGVSAPLDMPVNRKEWLEKQAAKNSNNNNKLELDKS